MTAEEYREEIIANMRSVGTYKPEFEKTVTNLAKLYVDMEEARKQFDASGGRLVVKHTNKGGSTNLVKNPCYVVIEGLQNHILLYNRELGLTPAGLRKIKGEITTDDKKPKGLAAVIMEIEKSL